MLTQLRAWAFALALATSPALAHDGAHVIVFSAQGSELGLPGKASNVSSTIGVRMLETPDGRMAFDPAVIVAHRGETLRIVLALRTINSMLETLNQ